MSQNNKVEDLRLPLSVIGRIVKDALPSNASLSKDARIAISRAAAVFVVHLTNYANDYASAKKRKTLTAEDVMQAIKLVDCENIEKPLKEAIELWKLVKLQKSEEAKKRKAEKLAEKQKAADESLEMTSADETEDSQIEDEDEITDTIPLQEDSVRDIEDL
ncbi:unnamed protein product [Auanema sp. JU1783]|nr:unnamed protein product [Auanema sp. JU1783]